MRSETQTGNRNHAIAYLMRNSGTIDEGVNESLQQYFAQCLLLVTCQDMAMMAATLANMGTNPITESRVFDFRYIKYVLAVMFTCGLYDYAGGWAYEVGLPAKSGVGGGIFGVVKPAARNLPLFTETGRAGQQRSRNHGLQRTREPLRPACVRVN
jgi:glutaminase